MPDDPHVREGWIGHRTPSGGGPHAWQVTPRPHVDQWHPEGEACLVLTGPAIEQHAAGQAALALLTGDRREEAMAALAEADQAHRLTKYGPMLDALAALLPTGAPNA